MKPEDTCKKIILTLPKNSLCELLHKQYKNSVYGSIKGHEGTTYRTEDFLYHNAGKVFKISIYVHLDET